MAMHPESFYRKAALLAIQDMEYYDNVRKCGIYEGKRAYEPKFKLAYRISSPIIGVAPVVLVADDGSAECRNFLNFSIYEEIRKNTKHVTTK